VQLTHSYIYHWNRKQSHIGMILPPPQQTTVMSGNNHQKPIAPKLGDAQSSSTKSEAVSTTTGRQGAGAGATGYRKKIAFQHPTFGYAVPAPLPAKVARRNARERNRVKQVNCGFEMLRQHIPSAAKQKKMSKVDTLRHAVDYIQKMRQVLREQQIEDKDLPPQVEPVAPSSHAAALPSTTTTTVQTKKMLAQKTKKNSSKIVSPPPLMLPKPAAFTSAASSPPMMSSSPMASSSMTPPPLPAVASTPFSSHTMSPGASSQYSAPLTPRTPTTPSAAGGSGSNQLDFLANNPHLAGHPGFGMHQSQQQQQQHQYMGSCNESGYESSSSSFYCHHQQQQQPQQHVGMLGSPSQSSVRSSLDNMSTGATGHNLGYSHQPTSSSSPDSSLLYSPKGQQPAAPMPPPLQMYPQHQQQLHHSLLLQQQQQHSVHMGSSTSGGGGHFGNSYYSEGVNSEEDELLDVIAKWQDD